MSVICPTVTTLEPHAYRQQMEQIASFVSRVHIDLADGEFTHNKLIDLAHVWWPHNVLADLHVMYKNPQSHIDKLIALNPNMVILHAESDGDFLSMATDLHESKILVGVALLEDTPVEDIEPALDYIDHVLIFSGELGKFGGTAQLDLLDKVRKLKRLKPSLEIGWDGGIDRNNARQISKSGVDVLNVGGFIQQAKDPHAAYKILANVV